MEQSKKDIPNLSDSEKFNIYLLSHDKEDWLIKRVGYKQYALTFRLDPKLTVSVNDIGRSDVGIEYSGLNCDEIVNEDIKQYFLRMVEDDLQKKTNNKYRFLCYRFKIEKCYSSFLFQPQDVTDFLNYAKNHNIEYGIVKDLSKKTFYVVTFDIETNTEFLLRYGEHGTLD